MSFEDSSISDSAVLYQRHLMRSLRDELKSVLRNEQLDRWLTDRIIYAANELEFLMDSPATAASRAACARAETLLELSQPNVLSNGKTDPTDPSDVPGGRSSH